VPNDSSGGTNIKSVVIEEIPNVRVEKPFIVLNDKKRWELHVPDPHFDADSVTGPHLSVLSPKEIRSFTCVKVIAPRNHAKNVFDVFRYNTIDDADMRKTEEIQAALDEGKDLIICPGEYFLNRSLIVKTSDQVILGLGLPSLIAPQDGSPCIRVIANTPGVRIAGIILEAATMKLTPSTGTKNVDGVRSLIDFGEPEVEDDGDEQNPGVLSDVFTRVGGSNLDRNRVTTDVMVRIHSGNVVGDNLWLWRADRVQLGIDENPNNPRFPLYHHIQEGECRVQTALEVNGNNVKMYGLFCDHATENQMVWKGNNGSVSLFQCKFPCDVSSGYGAKGYAGYVVDESVNVHSGLAVGIYSNFSQHEVMVPSAIIAPRKDGISFKYPFTVFIDGKGCIEKVLNNEGKAVNKDNKGPERL